MTENMIFTIEARHAEIAQKWIREHPCMLRGKKLRAAIGSKISYTFVDTTIGQLQNVNCACGKSLCINGQEI